MMINKDNQKRFKQIQKLVGGNKRILDIGCARGEIMQYLKDFDNDVIGLDTNEASVRICGEKSLEVYQCDIEREEIPELGTFDVILMAEVLEHLLDPLLVLRNKVYPLLKQGGSLVISVPNSAYLKHRINLLFGRVPDFGDNQSKLREKRPYNLFHKTLFSKDSIIKTLKMAGFQIKKIEPTQGVISNKILKLPIFETLRHLFPSIFAGGLTIVAVKK